MIEISAVARLLHHIKEKGSLHDSSANKDECDYYYELDGNLVDAAVEELEETADLMEQLSKSLGKGVEQDFEEERIEGLITPGIRALLDIRDSQALDSSGIEVVMKIMSDVDRGTSWHNRVKKTFTPEVEEAFEKWCSLDMDTRETIAIHIYGDDDTFDDMYNDYRDYPR